ncbi:hypothetical protein D9756_008747 [Leucocoprinus leucothites]|uniref:C3H1-type domain-containing protein n=1 Tax=Leucocoprinus leucothites TaxID=201217 RepID=A0A8H5CZT1_9AGAR|nr:hypothetical protein D9756_008747 [Leucoagaricus leucothites]
MLQLHRVRPSAMQADPLWQGKIICRQYVQGYCSYGARCKYDHPPTGEPQWLDPQPLPLYPQAEHGKENWFFSPERPYSEGQNNDVSRLQPHYPMTSRPLGNGTFSHGTKVPRSQTAAHDYVDPKKIRSIIAWKTTPCKHFVKNNGWCPLGDACNFIHDWQLVYSTMWNRDIIRKTAESSARPDGNHKATSHCWAHVQGFCGARSCPHFHPADIQPYVKYTPCPAWVLCDRRSTCPFKHWDVLPPGSQESEMLAAPPPTLPPPPPPPAVFYPPPPPPPPPATYTPTVIPTSNQVEVNGTTYFSLAPEASLADDFTYPQNGPIAVPVPMAALPPTHFLSEGVNPPSLSPMSSHHYVPQAYQPHVEPLSFLEQAYVNEPSPLLSPPDAHAQSLHVMPPEDTRPNHSEFIPSSRAESEPIPNEGSFGETKNEAEADPTSGHNSAAEPDTTEDHRRKRKSHGHVRRISINVKTGEVIERTLDGRHGVYGL